MNKENLAATAQWQRETSSMLQGTATFKLREFQLLDSHLRSLNVMYKTNLRIEGIEEVLADLRAQAEQEKTQSSWEEIQARVMAGPAR